MYLAEALNKRRDLTGRIAHYKGLLPKMVYRSEGRDLPLEPTYIIGQLEKMAAQYEKLVRAINKTNLQTIYEDGKTLTDAIAERDTYDLLISFCKKAIEGIHEMRHDYNSREMRLMLDISKVEQQMQQYLDMRREMDSKIQRLNWMTKLVDD